MHLNTLFPIASSIHIEAPITAAAIKEIKAWCGVNCEGYWLMTQKDFIIGCAPKLPSPITNTEFAPPVINCAGYLLLFSSESDSTKFLLTNSDGPKRRRKSTSR